MSDEPLASIAATFALDDAHLACVFGVTPKVIARWRTHGVADVAREKVAVVAALAALLARKLKTESVPEVVRRPAQAYGGRTALELIAEDRHAELLRLVEESFEHSQSA
jgi:hypothetical protein